MSHNLGRLVPLGTRIGPDSTTPPTSPGVWQFNFTPGPAPLGGSPRFVILHFTALSFPAGARLEVDVRYDTDRFDATSGADAWSRPIDPLPGPIIIRYFGAGPSGGVTLAEYGSGEPTITGMPGTSTGSRTNPDPFLHTDPYVEPEYETRLKCGPFDWQNAAEAAPGSIEDQCAKAVCVIFSAHAGHLSSCSATLIDADLVLTAAHCMATFGDIEARSASVSFDYATTPGGTRPPGYFPRFHKVKRIVRRGSADWLVFQIDTPPGGLGIAPRQLRAAGPMTGETVFAIHHPHGAVKKLQPRTLGTPPSLTPVEGFDFAGGSSGSALFDAMGQILGGALSWGPDGSPCRSHYVPASTVRAQLATPPVPPTPFDVMLVMDRSGSMSSLGTSGPGRTKMVEAREAASLFVQLLRLGAGDQAGMVAFSTAATRPPNSAIAPVNAAKKTELVGPAPYTGGRIGSLTPGGMTSIGDGIQAGMESLGPGGPNHRAILLMTDGLQNTPPMIADVESMLGDTKLCVVGFGTEDQLDGALLTRLARNHDGIYTHARHGVELKKFFGLCFGNIFEAGALTDPDRVLPASDGTTRPAPFEVCDEERITAIVGWDDPSQTLAISLTTPGGVAVNDAVAGVHADRGVTWHFLRVPLPHGGEVAGTWKWTVMRLPGGEFPPPPKDIRYFITIIAAGGPRLEPLPYRQRIYSGDPVTALVALRYTDGTTPHAEVQLAIEAPDVALGRLVTQAGLAKPIIDGDAVDAFRATLQKIAAGPGGLVIPTRNVTVPLRNDDSQIVRTMEPSAVYGALLDNLTRNEGTYTFHARARYGNHCHATREAIWSIYVECGIDPRRTKVEIVATVDAGGGRRQVTIRLTPQDRYGNPLGPGRGDQFDLFGTTGSTTTGPVRDRGDGSYDVDVIWDPSVAPQPGVVISQPERPPVTIAPPVAKPRCPIWLCVLLALLLVIAVLVILLR